MNHWTDVEVFESTDTDVSKYVFSRDDAVAEAVLYKYGSYESRTVICCSTQSGCPVGCRFCGAGNAFIRSLSDMEIVEQVSHMLDSRGILPWNIEQFQIMFMSMGEPALNQQELVSACRFLAIRYPTAKLLISTSAPAVDYLPIFEVSKDLSQIGLQFSVHESTDKARNALIPLKGKLTLFEIAELGEAWAFTTGRTPFFNYCVHDGNNSAGDVARLRALFNPKIWQATLSVVCESGESVAAANARQRSLATDFESAMAEAGYSTRTFDPAGQDDIGGGCGQLWFVQQWMRAHPSLAKPSVGARLPVIHAPQM